ncbi:MAG: hypothetical protein AAFX05_08995 [Planctomycetota bacterium]
MAAKKAGPPPNDYRKNGIVMIVDVVHFSTHHQEVQLRIVQRLWEHLHGHALVQELGDDVLVNCTGDGALVAFPLVGGDVDEGRIIELANSLMNAMRSMEPRTFIRIGIDRGPFTCVELPGVGPLQAIGNCPNACARLCNIGSSGDIIVSERFYDVWYQREKGVQNMFVPKKYPVEVSVKHGVVAKLRVYDGQANEVDRAIPPRLATLQLVEQLLYETIADVEETLVEVLRELEARKAQDNKSKLTAKKIDARVSIWGYEKDENGDEWLYPTDWRFHREDKQACKPGKTVYSLKDGGEGPAGRAFIDMEPKILHGLEASTRPGYKKALREWGLLDERIDGFQRKSRGFLCLPFGLALDSPEGILCIDTLNPLSMFDDSELAEIVGLGLQDLYNARLSALWRMRRSS